jgi:hypothetical protein
MGGQEPRVGGKSGQHFRACLDAKLIWKFYLLIYAPQGLILCEVLWVLS